MSTLWIELYEALGGDVYSPRGFKLTIYPENIVKVGRTVIYRIDHVEPGFYHIDVRPHEALDRFEISVRGKSPVDFHWILSGETRSCLLYTSPSPRD